MSIKRRDNKNRILRNGESQRADGRYAYVYVDANGKQKFIYSWKLESTDRLPQGKRDCVSLRDKIKALKRDMEDGIVPNGGELTVLQLVQKYTAQKTGVRLSTKSGYNYVIQILEKEQIGSKRIDRIKMSDAKEWFVKLQSDGKSYGTIHYIRGVVKPAFQMAVDDQLIRKNPFDFNLATIVSNNSKVREGITEEQEKAFLDFISSDKCFCRHYDAIYILFNTGLRISELAGLTVFDIDFENNKIRVDHQLLRRKEGHHMKMVIEKTKTDSGIRYIPMTEEVSECFKRIIEKHSKSSNGVAIDGLQNFLFLSKNGVAWDAVRWGAYFHDICTKYNDTHEEQLKVTPHVCRHTFCSKMARSGMNPKTLQYIMGHSDISITLNTYTHLGYEDAKKEMERIYKI
ncbi:MAG: site-specific integrase [Lachnospiraceae bacterium]